VFVLEGEVTFAEHDLKAGDYMYTPPHRKHAVWAKQGCVILLCVPEEVVILKNAHTGSAAVFGLRNGGSQRDRDLP
jgi:quercetin dioxygenase-like cupin family protein